MVRTFHPNLSRSLQNWFDFRFDDDPPYDPPPLPPQMAQPAVRPPARPAPIVDVTANTVINGTDVTFGRLMKHFQIYQGGALRAEVGVERARELERDVVACMEIHKEVRRMIHLQNGVRDLVTIAGRDRPIGTSNANEILATFRRHLITGSEFHVNERYTPIYPRNGLLMTIEHLISDAREGLQPHMLTMCLNNDPTLPLTRLMFLINAYLDRVLRDFGRSGQMLHCSYVMNYLQMATGGYGHNLTTFITENKRPRPGEMFAAGCGPGNCDRVVLAMHNGFKKGLERIAATRVADAPPPIRAERAAFPAYKPPHRATMEMQRKLLKYLNDYRLMSSGKTLKGFESLLVDRSANDPAQYQPPDEFLRDMATALYAPGGAYLDDDGPTFVEENEMENPRSEIWTASVSLGGGRVAISGYNNNRRRLARKSPTRSRRDGQKESNDRLSPRSGRNSTSRHSKNDRCDT